MKLQDPILESPDRVRGRLGFARALGDGDLDAATACFARDGCLITPDATAIHGRDHIRPLLAQLISRGFEAEVEFSNVVAGGAVVMASERWRVSLGAGGTRFAQTLYPTLVMRQIEAEWKLAIAAPWGWAERGI